jgi:hypothetical protein
MEHSLAVAVAEMFGQADPEHQAQADFGQPSIRSGQPTYERMQTRELNRSIEFRSSVHADLNDDHCDSTRTRSNLAPSVLRSMDAAPPVFGHRRVDLNAVI